MHYLSLKENTKAPSPLPYADWRNTHYVRVRRSEGHAIHGAATTTEPDGTGSPNHNCWYWHWVGYATSISIQANKNLL